MNTGLYVPEISESLKVSRESMPVEVKPPLARAEMEACVSVVRRRLKTPLSAIIATSEALFNVTDLTPEELYEYLRQIRSNAYKMDEIINHLLHHSEVA